MEKSQLLLPLQQISLIMNERSIGILGGGQLACMLQQAAMNFGTSLSILEDSNSVIAAKYTPFFTKGSTLDYETVVEFGKNLKAISIEKEAVNTDALKYLKDIGVKVIPDPESIEIIQDKYRQKEFLLAHSLPALPGQAYASKAEFEKNIPPYPFIIKKRLAGYDGKGVMKISSPEDLKDVFDEPFFSEPLVDILYEISIIAIRDESGRVHCYEPAQMTNLKGSHILDYYIAPPSIDPALYEIAKKGNII